jgi:hypothetical protein
MRDGLSQPRSRRTAGEPFHKAGHRLDGERAEREHGRAAALHAPAQPGHRRPDRHRPAGADQQQRDLVDRQAEPVPGEQAGLVCPLQVVEGEDERSDRAQPVDHDQEPLHRGWHHVGARGQAAGVGLPVAGWPAGGVGLQQGGYLCGGFRLGRQRVDQRAQGQPLAQLIADRLVGPAAQPVGLRERSGEQR